MTHIPCKLCDLQFFLDKCRRFLSESTRLSESLQVSTESCNDFFSNYKMSLIFFTTILPTQSWIKITSLIAQDFADCQFDAHNLNNLNFKLVSWLKLRKWGWIFVFFRFRNYRKLFCRKAFNTQLWCVLPRSVFQEICEPFSSPKTNEIERILKERSKVQGFK